MRTRTVALWVLMALSAACGSTGRSATPAGPEAGGTPCDDAAAGCTAGSGGGAAMGGAPTVMCDGSERLRLQFVVLADGAHQGTSSLLSRNGALFLRVDGLCRYWVYGSGSANAPSRATTPLDPVLTGTLQRLDADALSQDLQYTRWSAYDGLHGELTASGLTPSVFTDGVSEFSCGFDCNMPGMPETAHDLRERALRWATALTDSGSPVTGAVRMRTYDTGTTVSDWEALGYRCAEWPMPGEPSAYAEGQQGTLVSDSNAERLRSLRNFYRAERARVPTPSDIPPWSVNVAIPVCADRIWSLVVADTIEPYERDGSIPLPGVD
jgi:hypothetical protein